MTRVSAALLALAVVAAELLAAAERVFKRQGVRSVAASASMALAAAFVRLG